MNEDTNSRSSDEDWRRTLTPQQYAVLREGATEPPFSGKYVDTHEAGVYRCAACGNLLFTSDTKFESGSGWPSFYDVAEQGAVRLLDDDSHGVHRVEARCAVCDSHLGHVFHDAYDQPTGERYCMNSLSLKFEPKP